MNATLPSRERSQQGLVLPIVVLMGVIILLIASATFWSLKQQRMQTGQGRKDFQSVHAAEAGIKYFQNRLNGISFCQSWLGHDDSLAVQNLLHDFTVALPTPYGKTRGFMIRNASVIPGIRPFAIHFESVGGVILPNGSLDTTNGWPIICDVYMRTSAEFVFYVQQNDEGFWPGVHLKGRVFARSIWPLDGDVFDDLVSTVLGIVYFSGVDSSTVTFMKGTENVSANPYTLDNIRIAWNGPPEACGGGIKYSYSDLAIGMVPGDRRGFAYNGRQDKILVDLDEVTQSGGSVAVNLYEFDSMAVDGKGRLAMRASLPRSQFNGVLFINGDVFIRGSLRGTSLTVVASDDIFAVHNILCVGTEAGGDTPVTLGLIAQDKFYLWRYCPTRLTLNAVIIALDNHPPELGLPFQDPDYRSSSWSALGPAGLHPGVDANGNPASNLDLANWTFNLLGGIITRNGGGFALDGSHGWAEGKNHIYTFNQNNVFNPPPYFPMLSAALPGVPRWGVKGWEEK